MRQERATYFVTGGTGFIGRWLVDCLIRRGGEIRLLRRASTAPDTQAALSERWQDLGVGSGASITWVDGDVCEPGLGLADPRVALVDHFFHLAALYDLDASAERLHAVNVGGTENVLALLSEQRFAGVLHHVSSIAAAGDFQGRFLESMLDEGQRWPHPYQHSKADSERLVRQAATLRSRIYRPGTVVGDSVNGEALRIDGAYLLFEPLAALRRMIPAWMPLPAVSGPGLPIVPVDFVARAIDELAHAAAGDGSTFHVVDPAAPSARRTLDILSAAGHGPRFRQRVPKSKLTAAKNAATLFLGQDAIAHWSRRLARRLGAPESALDALNTAVTFDTANLERGLAASGLTCPPLEAYAKHLWRYWEDHLDPNRDPEAKRHARLAGTRILVTGASSGVGEALALACARYGARLVLVARRQEELERVAASARDRGGEAHVVVADLRDPEACDRTVREAQAALGAIDVLVNNAAKSIRRLTVDALDRAHDYERTMQLNYFAPVRMTLALLPSMRAQQHGQIVNVLTWGIWVGTPRFGAYLPSKCALESFGAALAAELWHDGIRVSDVLLPWVRTSMLADAYDDVPMMNAEQAAGWILHAIVDRKRRVAPSWAKLVALFRVLDPEGQTRTLNALLHATSRDKEERREFALERRLLRLFGVKGTLF